MDKLLTDLLGSGSAASATADAKTPARCDRHWNVRERRNQYCGDDRQQEKQRGFVFGEPRRGKPGAKLTEVRTHLTAYAAAKSGSGTTTPKSAAAASATSSPSAGATSSASNAATAKSSSASIEQNSAGTQGSAASQSGAGERSVEWIIVDRRCGGCGPVRRARSRYDCAATRPQLPRCRLSPAGQVDEEAARRRALTAARDSLSQLTQLPAATQLDGEARAQVAQLISNFNELITTQVQWRASYAKVAANLDALIGPDNTDAEAAGGAATPLRAAQARLLRQPTRARAQPSAATPTAGSSDPRSRGHDGFIARRITAGHDSWRRHGRDGGRSRHVRLDESQVDPTIRAKLIELRQNLKAFEKASGGAEK